ncbi:uncharacterized protein J5M81_016696 [Pluvialis apricaria]
MYWYQDNHCKNRVSKLAVGLGLAVAVLAVTVAILAVFLFRAQNNSLCYSTQKAMKQKWYEDMPETWSLPGSFTLRNRGARPEDNFQVDLESVNTSAQFQVLRPEKFSTQL